LKDIRRVYWEKSTELFGLLSIFTKKKFLHIYSAFPLTNDKYAVYADELEINTLVKNMVKINQGILGE